MDKFPLLQDHTRLIALNSTVYKVKVTYDAGSFREQSMKYTEIEAHDEIEQVLRAVLYINKHGGALKPILTKHFIIRPKKFPWTLVSKFSNYAFTKEDKIYETCKFVFQLDVSQRKSLDVVERSILETRKNTQESAGSEHSELHDAMKNRLRKRRYDERICEPDSKSKQSREMQNTEVRKESNKQSVSLNLRHRGEKDKDIDSETDTDSENMEQQTERTRQEIDKITNRDAQTKLQSTCNHARNKETGKSLPSSGYIKTDKKSRKYDPRIKRRSKRLKNRCILSPIHPSGSPESDSQENYSQQDESVDIVVATVNSNKLCNDTLPYRRSARLAKGSNVETSSQSQDESIEDSSSEPKRRSARIAATSTPLLDIQNAERNTLQLVSRKAVATIEHRENSAGPIKGNNPPDVQDSPSQRTRSRLMSPGQGAFATDFNRQSRHMDPEEEARRIESLQQKHPTQVYRNVLLAQGRDRHTVELAERAETDKLQQLYRPTATGGQQQQPVNKGASKRRSSGLWGVVMDTIITPTKKYFSKN